MSDKNLSVLSIAAVVMVVIAFFVGSSQPTVSFEFAKGQLLIPNLDPAQIQQITIEKGKGSDDAGDTEDDEGPVKLRRAGREFVVESLTNYPASNREINTLMRNVLDIRLAGEESSDPASHADFEVDGSNQIVTFGDADGQALVKLFIGKAAEGGGGPYVRLGSSDTIYRTEEFLSIRNKGLDFVDKALLQVTRDDIAKVSVASEGPVYAVESPEAGKVELQSVPEGKKVKGTEHESVFGACTYLNFDDFKSQSEAEDLTFDKSYTLETRNGAVYRLEIAKQGEDDDVKWWARCSARYTGPAIETLTVTRGAEGDAADAEIKKNEGYIEANNAVQQFGARHQSWIYAISSWKAESMTKKLDDLLEEDDGKPSEVQVSHILIPYQGAERAEATVTRTKDEAKAEAERLLAEVTADPTKFADLAKEHSSCTSAPSGGDLGMVSEGSGMAAPFEEASLNLLEVGAISEVVETTFGFHVITRTK